MDNMSSTGSRASLQSRRNRLGNHLTKLKVSGDNSSHAGELDASGNINTGETKELACFRHTLYGILLFTGLLGSLAACFLVNDSHDGDYEKLVSVTTVELQLFVRFRGLTLPFVVGSSFMCKHPRLPIASRLLWYPPFRC